MISIGALGAAINRGGEVSFLIVFVLKCNYIAKIRLLQKVF